VDTILSVVELCFSVDDDGLAVVVEVIARLGDISLIFVPNKPEKLENRKNK